MKIILSSLVSAMGSFCMTTSLFWNSLLALLLPFMISQFSQPAGRDNESRTATTVIAHRGVFSNTLGQHMASLRHSINVDAGFKPDYVRIVRLKIINEMLYLTCYIIHVVLGVVGGELWKF